MVLALLFPLGTHIPVSCGVEVGATYDIIGRTRVYYETDTTCHTYVTTTPSLSPHIRHSVRARPIYTHPLRSEDGLIPWPFTQKLPESGIPVRTQGDGTYRPRVLFLCHPRFIHHLIVPLITPASPLISIYCLHCRLSALQHYMTFDSNYIYAWWNRQH